jgi:putative heme-binding domain-containing protein
MLFETQSQNRDTLISMFRFRPPLVLPLLILLASGYAAQAQSVADNLPAGRGKAEFVRACSQCHGIDIVVKKSNTTEGWNLVVDDMAAKGAQATHDEFDLIVKYLAANFGPKGEVAKGAGQELTSSKGKELVNSSNCLSCHRIGPAGSRVGPNLTDIGDRRTPEQLEHALTKPDEEVLPENRFVTVTLDDRTAVKGRLLNHDAMSVQMLDMNEQLRSFETSKIKGYNILTKGLMPSYEGKLSAQDIAEIVAYLSSLKGSQ